MPNNYFVRKDSAYCRIAKDGLNPYGILVPFAEGETPKPIGQGFSAGKLKAMRAISRTLKVAAAWRSSVLSDWVKVKHVTDPGVFTIEKRKVE